MEQQQLVEQKEQRPTVSADEARKVLEQEQSARMQACSQEIEAVLAKHGCSLDASMVVTTRGVQPSIQVIPRTQQ